MRAGRLALALEEFEPAPWPVSLVYAGQGLLPLKVRAFLDFASPQGTLARRNECTVQLIDAETSRQDSRDYHTTAIDVSDVRFGSKADMCAARILDLVGDTGSQLPK